MRAARRKGEEDWRLSVVLVVDGEELDLLVLLDVLPRVRVVLLVPDNLGSTRQAGEVPGRTTDGTDDWQQERQGSSVSERLGQDVSRTLRQLPLRAHSPGGQVAVTYEREDAPVT
jgi:hypothetical protein